MSKLRLSNGDDHPEAARKLLDDASALRASNRFDGASYLTGYVVECSLKTLIQHESGVPEEGHSLNVLATRLSTVCAIAGGRTARYLTPAVLSVPSGAVAAWRPAMRYRAPSMAASDAAAWFGEAQIIYQATVGQMFLDGVI
jgi:hypothetical protein